MIVGRAAKVYRSLTSLRADFKQVIDDEAVGTFESRGVMVQSGQNKLTMRFSDPKGDAIVLDGKFVWVYTPSTTPGQVLRMPIPDGPGIRLQRARVAAGQAGRALPLEVHQA